MASSHSAQIDDKYRWFFMEYDPLSEYGRMPQIFCRKFYDKIPGLVIFCDKYNNEMKVQVCRKNGELYLTNGWLKVGRMYNLSEGGWLKIYYYGDSEFIMEVLNSWMVEVKYPQPEPTDPIVINDDYNDKDDNKLGPRENRNIYYHEEEDDSQLDHTEDGNFYYSTEKKLTAHDVYTSSFPLSAPFCALALSRARTKCALIDEKGKRWPCKLWWSARATNECHICAGRSDFVKKKRLKKGNIIRFGAARDDQSKIYVIVA